VRWRTKRWDPADGIVRTTKATAPILARHRLTARPYSVTALQKFAACPYRFLLSAIHRLEPREDAVALIRLDPLTRGRMIHETQANTLRALRDAHALPINETRFPMASELLERTVSEVEAKYREDLAPAIERVWQDEVDEIRADMRIWLRRLSDDASEWTPLYFEYTFGLDRGAGYDEASRAEPVRLSGGWLLRGAVDLIERHEDGGHLRVTDHKTGQNRTTVGWIVGRGETLQPVLYSFAVEAALGETVSEARLSFSTTRGGFTERVVPMSDFARLYGTQVLETIDDAIERGILPPAPRKGACEMCDFRAVCGPLEETRAGRKERDFIDALTQLRQLP
jgi:CRISPR/Cas system-associated exonuclease Cas4 (RecB family)